MCESLLKSVRISWCKILFLKDETKLTYQKIEDFDVMQQLLEYKLCNVEWILGYNRHVQLVDDTHKYTCNRLKKNILLSERKPVNFITE